MKDLRALFTVDGILRDQNADQVPDAVALTVMVEDDLAPLGLIDFWARIGLETTEMDLPPIPTVPGHAILRIRLNLHLPEDRAELRLQSPSEVVIEGGSEAAVSRLLKFVASSFPDALPITGETMTTLFVEGTSVSAIVDGRTHDLQPVYDETPPDPGHESFVPMESLTQLFSAVGVYQGSRRLSEGPGAFGFFFRQKPTIAVLQAATRLASRLGLMSTGLRFPLSAENEKELAGREVVFVIDEASDLSPGIHLGKKDGGNKIFLCGDRQCVIRGLHILAEARCPEDGGSWGRWEAPTANDEHPRDAAPELMHDSWTDKGEVERFKAWVDTTADTLLQTHPAGQVVLTAFLSKPRNTRDSLKMEILRRMQAKYPDGNIHVNIFSGFKPGFFWIRDHLSPMLAACEPDRLTIRFAETCQPGALELPIRWLQELYPIDEWLAAHLDMDADHIRFEKAPPDAPTYTVEAWRGESMAGSWQLAVPTTRMPYVDGRFSMPVAVHAAFQVDGKIAAESKIGGDRERFFRQYSSDFLPALTRIVLGDAGAPVSEPLFSSIEIHVHMDEEEVALGIDDEHIAPLEMLHEDIYFYTLAWFAHVGEKKFGTPLNAPGAILPFMHHTGKSPHARIKVNGYVAPEPYRVSTRRLYIDDNAVRAEMTVNGKNVTRTVCPEGPAPDQQGTVSSTYTVARSFNNRPVRAVEITAPRVSSFRSLHALTLFKPTILMETGHHGNEISSTPAMTELMEMLCTSDFFRKRLNMVILHGSNPDGIALHQQLSAEHPHWMFHGARFNAVGLEFSQHYFKETVFGEARALPKLFQRWRPDVLVDNHGIPSHEWAQPYAGYNSPPMFRVSYWLPYALLYGIAICPEKTAYPIHARAFEEVRSAVDAAFGAQAPLMRKNRRLMARFRKYGHQWLPEKFPLENMGNHIFFYRMEDSPNMASTHLGLRHPEEVTLHLVTEVPDETVTGESLEMCKACQTLFNRVVLQWLAETRCTVERRTGKGWIQYRRSRPLVSGQRMSGTEKTEE